ncbi:GrpB family protein [Labrys portucalensis]|uniref:GrpB family protein n=1 Tax=Labrys neptuniae TaxID=376174 RepID=A0ABV6ZJL7_9HYPH
MVGPVIIVPYDPTWPEVFARIRDEIAIALGPIAREIRHIGSTSVPGLAAKPIIDIDVVIFQVIDTIGPGTA